jgi:hypothetical protein
MTARHELFERRTRFAKARSDAARPRASIACVGAGLNCLSLRDREIGLHPHCGVSGE